MSDPPERDDWRLTGPPQQLVDVMRELKRSTEPGPRLAYDTMILWELGDGSAVVNTGKYLLIAKTSVPLALVEATVQEVRGTSGSITVDLLTFTPGGSPTFTSICNGDKLTISSGRYTTAARADMVASGWSCRIPRGTGLVLSVDSVSSFTQIGATFGFIRLDAKDQR